MADNVVLNSGSGGATAAADDIGGIHYQRVKPNLGVDGTAVDAIPVSNGLDTTATGVQAVGIVAQLDDTATGTVTENQFAPVRLSTRRALLVEGVASGTAQPVSAASLPLPSDASTETTLSALAGDVGDTADAAATAGGTGTLHAKTRLMTSQLDSIKTAVETLDNAISGTEMQVDVVAALPAGTNNIGDVDVLSIVPGTGATNLGKAIDTAVGATDTGVLILARRDDALGALTPVESDAVELRTDANGALWTHDDVLEAALSGSELQVDIVAALPAGTNNIGDVDILSIAAGDNNIGNVDVVTSALPTGASTLAEQQTQTTALQLIDDTVYTDDTSTHATGTSKGLLIMAAAAPTDAAVNANDIGAVAMTVNRELLVQINTALPAGTNNIGDVDVLSIAAGDNNIGNVDVVTLPNVTLAAGTNTNEVVGDVAHDAAVAGNPILVSGVAQNVDDTAPPNRVSAESDATRIATDFDGAVFARPHGPQIWSYHSNGSTALTDDAVHAAPGVGLSLYVTDICFSSGAATAINAFFEEATTTVLGPFYLEAVAGRGMKIHFQTPKKITANTALTVTTSASIAHSVDVTGFTAQG